MVVSYLQTDKHFSFLKWKILILVTENCLEIENVLKFESLEVCKRRKSSLKRVALQITKIQISVSRKKMIVCLELSQKHQYFLTKMYLYSYGKPCKLQTMSSQLY